MSKFFYDTKTKTFIELKAKDNPRTTTTTRQLTTDSIKPTKSRYEEEGFINEFSGQILDSYNLDTLPGRRDDDTELEKARQETVDRISKNGNGNQNTSVVDSDVMGNQKPKKLTKDSNDELELARQEIVNRISGNSPRR